MKKILIMDAYSTIHVGNGALLENTINICNQVWPKCHIKISTGDRETNKAKYDEDRLISPMFGGFWFGRNQFGKIIWAAKQSVFMLIHIINENTLKIPSQKLAFSRNQKDAIIAIDDADICISCSGEMISDTFYQMLPFWLFTYWLAIKKDKKFVMFPQSIGPLRMKWTRTLVKMALAKSYLLVGRDKPSYLTLQGLGFDQRILMRTPDVAIQQEAGQSDVCEYFLDRKKKVIGITISNPPSREMGVPIDFVKTIGAELQMIDPQEFKILIMPSNYAKEGLSADYALCQRLKEYLEGRFDTSILQNRPYFPEEYTSLLSQLHFFISTRMHVTILATSIGTPTIAVNTQHKILGYMSNINMEQFCVEYSDIKRIRKLIDEINYERQVIVNQLISANNKLKEEHEAFIARLQQIA